MGRRKRHKSAAKPPSAAPGDQKSADASEPPQSSPLPASGIHRHPGLLVAAAALLALFNAVMLWMAFNR